MASLIYKADTMEAALLDRLVQVYVQDFVDEDKEVYCNLNKQEVGELIKFLQRSYAKMQDEE